MKIAEYNDDYKEEVIDLILSIQQNEFNIPITINDQADIKNTSQFYQNGNSNFWIALIDNKVTGTIALLDIGNKQAALRKMFVAKEYRGKELMLASKLLNTLMNWCKNKNVTELFLGTTDKFIAAHKFYEKNGFAEINKNDLPEKFPLMQVDSKFYKMSIL